MFEEGGREDFVLFLRHETERYFWVDKGRNMFRKDLYV